MSTFDEIVAGLDMNFDAAEREVSLLEIGRLLFDQLEEDLLRDPVSIYLITATAFLGHFLRMVPTEVLPLDSWERVSGHLNRLILEERA